MNQQIIKNCITCAHSYNKTRYLSDNPEFARCARFGGYTEHVIYKCQLKEWIEKPQSTPQSTPQSSDKSFIQKIWDLIKEEWNKK